MPEFLMKPFHNCSGSQITVYNSFHGFWAFNLELEATNPLGKGFHTTIGTSSGNLPIPATHGRKINCLSSNYCAFVSPTKKHGLRAARSCRKSLNKVKN
jgi:hypothetical protein